jgi:hypothetical protein
VAKVSELKTARQLNFPVIKWNLTPSSLIVIQLCRNLPDYATSKYAVFLDNFFTNARLFKALKIIGIGACGTAKSGCGFPVDLLRLRAAATKNKDWGKKAIMTTKADKKTGIEEGDILCMAWVDLNIVQFMTIIHTVDDLKAVSYKNIRRRHGIPSNSGVVIDEVTKLSFPEPIVDYNQHMGGSDGNAQQRSYYCPERSDRRYWWPLFIFLLKAVVLNVFKIWKILYPDSTLSHLEFQREIIKDLITNQAGVLRKAPLDVGVISTQDVEVVSCEWKHLSKKKYCLFCKSQLPTLKRRRALAEIDGNCTKRQRASQIMWQCKSCGPCCKKEACWDILHS